MRTLAVGFLLLLAGRAHGHDQWANNTPVPAWVKSACCGPDEAHQLDASQVHRVKTGWMIDGLANVVPNDRVYPSQDGHAWGFWSPEGADAFVHCLFIPSDF